MPGFIVLPISRDPADAVQESYAVMQTYFPGWAPDPNGADPMTALLNAAAVLYTDAATLATSMDQEAFRYEGRTLDGLQPIEATPATGLVTFTAVDNSGWEVPEGTQIAGTGPTGNLVTFATNDLAVIAPGSTSVANVPVTAVLEGVEGNGVSGTGDFVQYLDFLSAVTFAAPTANGAEAESDQSYLDRYAILRQLSTDEPIRPADFATIGRYLAGTTIRALAVDGFNPNDSTTDNLATIALAFVNATTGTALGSTPRNAVVAQLQAMRESGWRVYGFDPTITPVDVEVSVRARPGNVAADVQDQVEASIANMLDPAVWGANDASGQALDWTNEDTVRIYSLAERILRVESALYIEPGTLKIRLHGVGSLAAADLLLPGHAPLPTTAGATISVTITGP